MAQKQRDLIEDDKEVMEQDPEVMPGFYQGDMAGMYHTDDTDDDVKKSYTICKFI